MKHMNEEEEAVALTESGGDIEAELDEEAEGEGSSEFDGEEWSEEEMDALRRMEAAERVPGVDGEGIPDVAGRGGHEPEQDGESADDGLPDALAGLGSQLQGLPKRVQRFVVRKMMKVKPVEPPSMNHMKRVSEERGVNE